MRRDCPDCSHEVFPRELYCAHCGKELTGAPESLLLPSDASRIPMLIGLLLDLLVIGMVVAAQFWRLHPLLILGLGLFSGLLYRTLARAHGRQSFGQAVFHLLTVSRDAGPAGYGAAARRTMAELVLLPIPGKLGKLDELSASYEVRLV